MIHLETRVKPGHKCLILISYLWWYVAVDLFWLLDFLRLALYWRVVLFLVVTHGGSAWWRQQRGSWEMPCGDAIVACAVEVGLEIDANAWSWDVLLHTALLGLWDRSMKTEVRWVKRAMQTNTPILIAAQRVNSESIRTPWLLHTLFCGFDLLKPNEADDQII